ncbi:MAG TPA: cytochrome C oxidase Cbb3 [Planctomycetaceae bacterium]|nr:cytochrome C oxidase Cbb3 [Planctomycetaceae bacterium]
MSSSTTSGSGQPELTSHDYDGIQEFDNPLPGWWKWMFVATIVFSVFYALYFHIGAPGRSIAEQYDAELAANTRLQFAVIGDLTADEATINKYIHEESWLKVGKVVFQANCISCHGRDGEGKVGPNLTDEAFKNIRNLEDIARVLNKGAGKGAMPAWESRLHPNEIVLVSAYVASLRGQNLPGKAAEGTAIDPWPEYVAPPKSDVEEQPTEG